MNPQLHRDITQRLERDFAFQARGEWLRAGKCPSCGKKSVWTHAEAPWVLRCERLNKCDGEWHVKELYPELFERWSERHPTTKAEPHAAADAFLRDGRGFNLDTIRGWYVQETYWDAELKVGSATVRFPVANGYWERIIDQPKRFGSKKARFKPGMDYRHTWWVPPSRELVLHEAKEIWIVEGIFDAIALLHHGITAVAAMSCNNDCAVSLKALAEACVTAKVERPRLVWALDADKAGQAYTRRWVAQCRPAKWDVSAAQIPQRSRAKLDWNDMHQRDALGERDIERYRYHGALLVAESAGAKAVLMYSRHGGTTFPFEFGSRLYWFKLDLEKFHKAAQSIESEQPELSKEKVRELALLDAHVVSEIAGCWPQVLYYQRHDLTDESWYYLRVTFPDDTPAAKNTFTAAQLTSAAEFKKRLLGMANGALFTGTTGMLDALVKSQTNRTRIPTVETVDFIGYSRGDRQRPHHCYILGDIAMQGGRIIERNEEDYFELGKLSIKSLNQSIGLAINTDASEFDASFARQIHIAYGAKGLVALVYWFGSLFAEQIREADKTYPFLELTGEPGAGKTTLIEFLWKLCGRAGYEGFNPSKSTWAAVSRNFAQVSNLPVVLIEGDRTDDAQSQKRGAFDYDDLKDLYNGRSVRSRGVKNSGNETYDPPFRGAVVISQNAPIQASEAVMSRILHLYFDRTGQTTLTRQAAEALERMPMESVSHFIVRALKAEAKVLDGFVAHSRRMEDLIRAHDATVRNVRVLKNHSQMMALAERLAGVMHLDDDMRAGVRDELIAMAHARQEALSQDHPYVAEFWELYHYLEGEDEDPRGVSLLNHARNDGWIAISLPHFEQLCADRKLRHAPIADLKRVLRSSRLHKFVGIRTVNSEINARLNADSISDAPRRPTSVKCWVFKQ